MGDFAEFGQLARMTHMIILSFITTHRYTQDISNDCCLIFFIYEDIVNGFMEWKIETDKESLTNKITKLFFICFVNELRKFNIENIIYRFQSFDVL